MLYIEFKLPYLKPNHYVICCFTYLGLEEKKRIDNNLAKKGQNEVTEHRLGIPESCTTGINFFIKLETTSLQIQNVNTDIDTLSSFP